MCSNLALKISHTLYNMSSPQVISRNKFAMIVFLRQTPVYVVNTNDPGTCALFVLGCDLCNVIKVGRVSIARMNI